MNFKMHQLNLGIFVKSSRRDEFSKILFLNGPGYFLLENVLIPIIFNLTREYFFKNQ